MILKSPYKLKSFIPWSKINITIGILGCVFCISVVTWFNFWFQWIFLNTFHQAYLQCCFELSLLIRELLSKTVKKFRPWKVFYCSISKSNSFIKRYRDISILIFPPMYERGCMSMWTCFQSLWVCATRVEYTHTRIVACQVNDVVGLYLRASGMLASNKKMGVSILYQWFWIANTPSIWVLNYLTLYTPKQYVMKYTNLCKLRVG